MRLSLWFSNAGNLISNSFSNHEISVTDIIFDQKFEPNPRLSREDRQHQSLYEGSTEGGFAQANIPVTDEFGCLVYID